MSVNSDLEWVCGCLNFKWEIIYWLINCVSFGPFCVCSLILSFYSDLEKNYQMLKIVFSVYTCLFFAGNNSLFLHFQFHAEFKYDSMNS